MLFQVGTGGKCIRDEVTKSGFISMARMLELRKQLTRELISVNYARQFSRRALGLVLFPIKEMTAVCLY